MPDLPCKPHERIVGKGHEAKRGATAVDASTFLQARRQT